MVLRQLSEAKYCLPREMWLALTQENDRPDATCKFQLRINISSLDNKKINAKNWHRVPMTFQDTERCDASINYTRGVAIFSHYITILFTYSHNI